MKIGDYIAKLEGYLSLCNQKLHEHEDRLTPQDEAEYERWHYKAHDANNRLNRAFAVANGY